MEDKIRMLLELYSIEDALEVLDITPEECIEVLVRGGHVKLPEFLDMDSGPTDEEQEEV